MANATTLPNLTHQHRANRVALPNAEDRRITEKVGLVLDAYAKLNFDELGLRGVGANNYSQVALSVLQGLAEAVERRTASAEVEPAPDATTAKAMEQAAKTVGELSGMNLDSLASSNARRISAEMIDESVLQEITANADLAPTLEQILTPQDSGIPRAFRRFIRGEKPSLDLARLREIATAGPGSTNQPQLYADVQAHVLPILADRRGEPVFNHGPTGTIIAYPGDWAGDVSVRKSVVSWLQHDASLLRNLGSTMSSKVTEARLDALTARVKSGTTKKAELRALYADAIQFYKDQDMSEAGAALAAGAFLRSEGTDAQKAIVDRIVHGDGAGREAEVRVGVTRDRRFANNTTARVVEIDYKGATFGITLGDIAQPQTDGILVPSNPYMAIGEGGVEWAIASAIGGEKKLNSLTMPMKGDRETVDLGFAGATDVPAGTDLSKRGATTLVPVAVSLDPTIESMSDWVYNALVAAHEHGRATGLAIPAIGTGLARAFGGGISTHESIAATAQGFKRFMDEYGADTKIKNVDFALYSRGEPTAEHLKSVNEGLVQGADLAHILAG